MHKFNRQAVSSSGGASVQIPRGAEKIYRRWLKKRSYALALWTSLSSLILFPLYHYLSEGFDLTVIAERYHRLTVIGVAGTSLLLLLLYRRARSQAEWLAALNFLALFLCSAIDVGLSERERRYTMISLLPIFISTFILTRIGLMTAVYFIAAVFFSAFNAYRGRIPEIIVIFNVAYFAAWWMAYTRIRSLQRISLDQAILYGRRVFDQRVALARNLHDSLGGDLMQLALQLAADTPREQMLDLAQAVIVKTKNLIYTLEPGHENVDFPAFVASYKSRLQQIGKLTVTLDTAGGWPHLQMDQNLNLQAIFSEWMTNSMRHGRVTAFDIFLRSRHESYYLLVRDNGAGFRWNGQRLGYGLRNIALRAELLSAKVFSRRTGKGTFFFLKGKVR